MRWLITHLTCVQVVSHRASWSRVCSVTISNISMWFMAKRTESVVSLHCTTSNDFRPVKSGTVHQCMIRLHAHKHAGWKTKALQLEWYIILSCPILSCVCTCCIMVVKPSWFEAPTCSATYFDLQFEWVLLKVCCTMTWHDMRSGTHTHLQWICWCCLGIEKCLQLNRPCSFGRLHCKLWCLRLQLPLSIRPCQNTLCWQALIQGSGTLNHGHREAYK